MQSTSLSALPQRLLTNLLFSSGECRRCGGDCGCDGAIEVCDHGFVRRARERRNDLAETVLGGLVFDLKNV